jgi:hypothetical protein
MGATYVNQQTEKRHSKTKKTGSVKIHEKSYLFKSATIATLIISLTVSSISICIVQSSSFFAPTWLKKGTYVEYTYASGAMYFTTTTSGHFTSRSFRDAVFRWECVDLNETVAELKISLNYTVVGGESVEEKTENLTTELWIKLSNRAVYQQNGTLLGTTHLWLPANPTPNDDIVLWDVPPDKVTLKPASINLHVKTPQGVQVAYNVTSGLEISKGSPTVFKVLCDFNTGVMCSETLSHEPVWPALGIENWFPANMAFADTNIDLGPPYTPPLEPYVIFLLIAVPVAFTIVFIVVYGRRRRKRITREEDKK